MICSLIAMMLAVVGCPDPKDHEGMYNNGVLDQAEAEVQLYNSSHSSQQQIIDTVTQFFGTMVGSSPYPGVRSTYGGTELMVQLSQINQDLSLLIGHDKAEKYMKEHHFEVKAPHIFLSGKVEGTGFIANDAGGHPRSDIGLTGAELDILAAYKALTGFMVIEFQSFPSPVINNRIANSNLFLDVAFLTIGDLNEFPMYLTIGQTFVPFGQYNSYNAFNDPLTKILFRTLAEDATIGFYNEHAMAQFFFYRGDSHADSGNNINNFGANVGVHFDIAKAQNFLQCSFVRNVADSLGMQLAFGNSRNTNTLAHVVPGINVNGTTQIGDHLFFVYEYNTAIRRFSRTDMAFSSDGGNTFVGARPQAFDVEASYQFKIGERPSGLSVGYSRSYQALGFNLPKWRLVTSWTTYIFKGTLLSFEYMHNKLYGVNDLTAGQVAFGPGGSIPYFRQANHKGRTDDTFTVDISFYW